MESTSSPGSRVLEAHSASLSSYSTPRPDDYMGYWKSIDGLAITYSLTHDRKPQYR